MKPAYFGKRKYFAHLRRLHGPAIWRILSKRKVASRAVVIIDIRNQLAPERNLIQDDGACFILHLIRQLVCKVHEIHDDALGWGERRAIGPSVVQTGDAWH